MDRPSRGQERASPAAATRARLDAVRIVVPFPGPAAESAARVLNLPGIGPGLAYLGEQGDAAGPAGLGRSPLHDAGVQIEVTDTGRGVQSVVRLRPCRRSRLTQRWLQFRTDAADELRIEEERSEDRPTLTAELESTLPPGSLTRALTRPGSAPTVLSPAQLDFLLDCADATIGPDTFRLLGPIRFRYWPAVRWHNLDLAVTWRAMVERSGPDVQVLDVSLRVEPEAAEIRQHALTVLLHRHGLHPEDLRPVTTRTLIEHLTGPTPGG